VSLPVLTPGQALLRLHAGGLPGLVLLESLGPVTAQSALGLLSAAPGAATCFPPGSAG